MIGGRAWSGRSFEPAAEALLKEVVDLRVHFLEFQGDFPSRRIMANDKRLDMHAEIRFVILRLDRDGDRFALSQVAAEVRDQQPAQGPVDAGTQDPIE